MATVYQGFTKKDLNDNLFQEILHRINDQAELVSWKQVDFKVEYGTATSLLPSNPSQILGLLMIQLNYRLHPHSRLHSKKIVFKSKTRGHNTLSHLVNLNPRFDDDGKKAWKEELISRGVLDFEYTELKCIQMKILQPLMPEIYWSRVDEKREIFVFAMEYLDPDHFTHINSVDVKAWNEESITEVLSGLADLHATYFNKTDHESVADLKHYFDDRRTSLTNVLLPNRKKLLEKCQHRYPDLLSAAEYSLLFSLVDNFQRIAEVIEGFPKTLLHRDVSTMNLCLRREPLAEGKKRLCLYDWDVACIGPAPIDLAIFLSYVIPADATQELWDKYIRIYIDKFKRILRCETALLDRINRYLEFDKFQLVFDACMVECFLRFFMISCGMNVISKYEMKVKEYNKVKIQYILHAMERNEFFFKLSTVA